MVRIFSSLVLLTALASAASAADGVTLDKDKRLVIVDAGDFTGESAAKP